MLGRNVSRMLVLVLTSGALATAGPAQAATTVSITPAPDPVETLPTQLSVEGTTDNANALAYLKVKPTGGAACGANPSADTGDSVINGESLDTGSYKVTRNHTFDTAGSYLLCAWVTDGYSDSVLAGATLTQQVRQPKLALSVAAPPSVVADAPFQVTLTAQAEAERSVYALIVPDTGRGCPANYTAATSVSTDILRSRWTVAGGPFTDVENVSLDAPGSYLACAYFQRYTADTVPEATAAAPIVVGPPPVTFTAAGSGSPIAQSAPVTRAGKRLAVIRVRGTLGVPAGVDRAKACRGRVVITITSARRAITVRKASVSSSTCAYAKKIRFPRSKVKHRRVTVTLDFPGNTAVARSSYSKSIKLRR